jgi:YD repeat-containing protein
MNGLIASILAARRLLFGSAALACVMLLALAPAHAKKPYLYIYNFPFGSPLNAGTYWSPGEACEASIDLYSNPCPGAHVTQGCPAWSETTVHPDNNSSNPVNLTLRRVTHSGGTCNATQDYNFYIRAFCGSSTNGHSMRYVGNGECRCPNGWFENSAGQCVASCPSGSANGVCLDDTLKANGPCIGCNGMPTAGTNPINVGSGSKYHREPVYQSASPGGLSLVLSYNSRRLNYPLPERATYFGTSWTSNFEQQVFPINTGAVTVRRGDGKEIEFRPSGGSLVPDGDVKDSLIRLVNGSGQTTGWEYHVHADNSVEEYEPVKGRITKIRFVSGVEQTMTYSTTSTPLPVAPHAGLLLGVADKFGRSLSFTYDGAARVVTMTDPAGQAYAFEYDGPSGPADRKNLTKVTFPDTRTRTFHYAESTYTSSVSQPNALTGITDEKGIRFATFGYDANGRAISSQHAGGVNSVSMTHGSGSTSVTDPRGNVRTFSFSSLLGVMKNTGITGPVGPEHGPASRTYDANGNVATSIDWNGNRTNYTYDLARNLETARTEALTSGGSTTAQTRTISTQWHSTFALPTGIAEPLRITTFTYDATGSTCGAKGALCSKSIQATTDTNGSLGFSATTSGSPRTWAYTYNTNGLVLTVDGPRTDVSDVTTYTYYADNDATVAKRGHLATITNAASQVISITSYNAHGQPLTIIDVNGLTTTLAYDERLRLTSRSVGSEVTSYDYDDAGQLTRVTLPDGSYLNYAYDNAHRLDGISDSLGNSITYTLDAMGNRTLEAVRDPASTLAQTRSRVYSSLNRLFQELGATSQTTEYTYDNQGNVLTVRDPLNKVTTNQYDALNRLKQVTDPGTGVTQYGYDGIDQLVSVSDPRSLVTTYAVNGLGNLTTQVSPDTGSTGNTYNAAGNLLTQTDAKGQVTTYVYDLLNRVTQITFHDGSKQVYVYDQGTNGVGRLSSITERDPSNAMTHQTGYTYDAHGRVTLVSVAHAGVTYNTAYGYDSAGRLASITYPSGRVLAYGLDGLGRVSSIQSTYSGHVRPLVASVVYHPFGGVKSYTLGNGQTYARSIDLDGRISTYTLGNQSFGIGYDAASRIEQITDLSTSAFNSYAYDALDRLTSATIPGTPYSYTYDAVGNRLSRTAGSGTENYTYSSTSNRIATVGARSFTFDSNGSTTNDGNNTYAYDVRGRMVQATSSIGATNYKINALGQRVRKTNSLDDTVFHYDTGGRLIAETTAAGVRKREIFYLGDIPVAVVQ